MDGANIELDIIVIMQFNIDNDIFMFTLKYNYNNLSNGYDPCQDFQEGSDRGLVVDEELSASERYLNLVNCSKF